MVNETSPFAAACRGDRRPLRPLTLRDKQKPRRFAPAGVLSLVIVALMQRAAASRALAHQDRLLDDLGDDAGTDGAAAF
ncbi:hypothetical protein, partial [uncultured Brevundimonas sp.]|uniref:hypothetical protein n=1 Tax=uncultured Brevundimonas sp. TaxID=213418 RepID=UPI0030EF9300